jgi:hypothetical protein
VVGGCRREVDVAALVKTMTETTKFIITVIAATIGSGVGTTIVGALFKKRFDEQLEQTKNRFTIGATSHMAAVAFDKHVEFCEKYAVAVNGALSTLFKRGPHQDILQDADNLVRIRLEWTLWVNPEVEAKLEAFEKALRTIGANAWLIQQLDPAHEDRTESISQAYNTFADVMGWPEWQGKPLTGDVAAQRIIEGLREVLSVGNLMRLREDLIKRAVEGLE